MNSSFYADSKIPLNIPPKAGLYFSFSEVMLGQATIPTKPIKLEILFTELERYKLKTKEKKEVIKSLYGISDGTNFYLNSRLYSKEPYFIKAKMMDAHFYFEDIVYNGLAQAALGMLGSALYEKKVGIIINTANGRLSILDENVFFEIIKPYPELLKMYEDSNKKLKTKRIILQKINQQLSDTFNQNE